MGYKLRNMVIYFEEIKNIFQIGSKEQGILFTETKRNFREKNFLLGQGQT